MLSRTAAEMKPGEHAVISGFNNDYIYLKLMEMGCLPGEIIRLNFTAPFGDPISYDVSGYNLSLRKSEAACILLHS